MRVWTKVISQWDEVLNRYVTVESESESFEYVGEVALCKGDQTAARAEAQQAAFNAQLMQVFNAQFAKQNEVMTYLNDKMRPIVDAGGKGFDDEALAAMRTNATDQLSASYQNAQKALQAKQFTSGGRDLPSGVNEQLTASLMASEAADKAQTQNEVTLQNENLKQQNYWNALNVLQGNAAMYNPQSYAQTATEGGNTVANLSQAVTASKKSGLMGMLGGLASAGIGAAGAAASGGATGGLAGLFGCWIAAASFNENFVTGEKTNLVRNWLWNVWRHEHIYAKPILWVYTKTGRWVAKQKILVTLLKPLFEAALSKAKGQK